MLNSVAVMWIFRTQRMPYKIREHWYWKRITCVQKLKYCGGKIMIWDKPENDVVSTGSRLNSPRNNFQTKDWPFLVYRTLGTPHGSLGLVLLCRGRTICSPEVSLLGPCMEPKKTCEQLWKIVAATTVHQQRCPIIGKYGYFLWNEFCVEFLPLLGLFFLQSSVNMFATSISCHENWQRQH